MKNVMGSTTASTVSATPEVAARLAGLRTLILALINESQFATETEKATAAQRVAGTQSLDTLTKWYRNTLCELAAREEWIEPIVYATAGQKEEIIRLLNQPTVTRQHKTRILLNINRLLFEGARNEIARLTIHAADSLRSDTMVTEAGKLAGFALTA